MNVARLELCKKLDELTDYRWRNETQYRWLCLPKLIHKGSSPQQDFSSWQVKHISYRGQYRIDWYAAYDLGYLLRKLPDGTQLNKTSVTYSASGIYSIDTKPVSFHFGADIPEDAICELCIKLISEGIIKP